MANTLLDSLDQIKKNYEQQLIDSKAAADAANAAAKVQYQQNMGQADKIYQPKLNAVYTGGEMARRALAERMANMGLGAAGGTSQRAGANLSNSVLKGAAGVGLEKQGYIDTQKNAMTQADAQHQASIADITAQNAANRNAAIQQQKNMIAQQFLSMYLSKRITGAKYNEYMKKLEEA